MSCETQETIPDIIGEARLGNTGSMPCCYIVGMPDNTTVPYRINLKKVTLPELLDRIEAAWKREAGKIERIVRDAVVDYNGMYTCAPNDEAEREVVERAETANEWLKSHGMEPEPFHFSKEEAPCL